MKSDAMKKHLDRDSFNHKLKNMDKDELDLIEYKIAEKIISDYERVQKT